MNIRKIIEYPYIKYLDWKNRKTNNISRRKLIKTSISAWDLLLFYLIGLGVLTISLTIFVAMFLIIKDIIS